MENKNEEIIRTAVFLLLKYPKVTGYAIWKKTGITESSISNYRNCKTMPSIVHAKAIIDYFEIINKEKIDMIEKSSNKYEYKERLKKFVDYLGIGWEQFENFVGLESGFIKTLNNNPASKELRKIENAYPDLYMHWIVYGIGKMLKSENRKSLKNDNQFDNHGDVPYEEKPVIADNEEDYKKLKDAGVPLLPEVNFDFAAGVIEIFSNTEFIKRYWYLPDCKDCDGVAQISGTSMMPTYPPGCWVVFKKVGLNIENPNTIDFGNVFGVVIQDPVTDNYHGHVKILRRYKDDELSKQKWIARSINSTDFDDFDIVIKQVRGLWIVKQHIVSDIML